jgi:signal transduction histidine kinase
MDELKEYLNNFLTFQNPTMIAIIVIAMVVGAVVLLFMKIIFPLQKKIILEKQRAQLEKAELMALFAELDPDPLIRINNDGIITNTNEASREIFSGIEEKGKKIDDVLPFLMEHTNYGEVSAIEEVGERFFSVIVRKQENTNFTNIYMHDVTQIKNYENALESYKNRLKSFAERLDTENETLKKTLSAELHDDIGQQLISLKLKVSNWNNQVPNDIEREVETIYQKIRNLSHNLRPVEIKYLGLEISLQSLVQKVSSNSSITGTFDYYGDEEPLNPQMAVCIYRITQEALANIIKHSKASEFSILIEKNKEKISAVISDNGIGIDPEYFTSREYLNSGTGLFILKERVGNFGGTVKINSIPDEGTTLFIQIPQKANK